MRTVEQIEKDIDSALADRAKAQKRIDDLFGEINDVYSAAFNAKDKILKDNIEC